MHSWIFRHRIRLRVIYGPLPDGPAPGLEPVFAPAAVERAESERQQAPGMAGLAGSVERGESFVLLHPMPRERAA